MMKDLDKTIHLSKNDQLVSGLVELVPKAAVLVEPFVGEGDLVKYFSNKWETYDIREGTMGKVQDTLTTPPDYKGKWVITNPPFLAKNKATDKTLFEKYQLDDLYKIFLHTILDAEGGLVIVPLNFITDENSQKIRQEFFDKFTIIKANLFTEPMFDTTTYSVMSFVFEKKKGLSSITIPCSILPQGQEVEYTIEKQYGWRLAGEFFTQVNKTKAIFGRYTTSTKDNVTNMKLYGLDTRNERIHISLEEPYCGKVSDRVYLTFTTKEEFTLDEQRRLAKAFNDTLNRVRDEYYNMILTNYRDYNRKRISFTFAYKLLSKIYKEKEF